MTAKHEILNAMYTAAGKPGAKGNCYLNAISLAAIMLERGRRPILNAGTSYWRRSHKDEDDNWAGYKWTDTGDPAFLNHMVVHTKLTGVLPEIHVWLVDRDSCVLIDPSTGDWPEVFATPPWDPSLIPPVPYISPIDSMSPHCVYSASREAIQFVFALLTTSEARLADRLLKAGL